MTTPHRQQPPPKPPPVEVKERSMALYKGKKFRCKGSGRIYVLVDVLLSHKPIELPGNQKAGDVRGLILTTTITPAQLGEFEEIAEPMPSKVIKA